MAKYKCPKCASAIESERSGCSTCGWPEVTRAKELGKDSNGRPSIRLQFSLRALLMWVTLACLVFAVLGAFGVQTVFSKVIGVAVSLSCFQSLYSIWTWMREVSEQ